MTTIPSTLYIHRLLDEAYAGIDMTPDVQDLKEEMRADLAARVAELEQFGLSAEAAARRAIDDLGDIVSIVDDMQWVAGPRTARVAARVRPKAAFVVRTVVLAAVALGALTVVGLGLAGHGVQLNATVGSAAVLTVVAGVVVADSLRQETTTNYPLPRGRAVRYGIAAALGVAGIGAALMYLADAKLPWLVAGGLTTLVSIVAFTYLGVTQTNRHKPWVVHMQAEHARVGDRFTNDPAAAARVGIYTLVIWIVAVVGFVALSLAVSWKWSWLALVAGLMVFMLMLARMLFGPEPRS
jgi:hypothetical protein